jgi:death on curing protein
VKEPLWIDTRDALILHDRLLALHGGAAAVRDVALLESAVARPRQLFTYDPSADVFAVAAAYTVGIVENHPFADGNKRTSFVIGILFAELNGYVFRASEEAAAQAVIDLAAGASDEAGYGAFLRRHLRRSKR